MWQQIASSGIVNCQIFKKKIIIKNKKKINKEIREESCQMIFNCTDKRIQENILILPRTGKTLGKDISKFESAGNITATRSSHEMTPV